MSDAFQNPFDNQNFEESGSYFSCYEQPQEEPQFPDFGKENVEDNHGGESEDTTPYYEALSPPGHYNKTVLSYFRARDWHRRKSSINFHPLVELYPGEGDNGPEENIVENDEDDDKPKRGETASINGRVAEVGDLHPRVTNYMPESYVDVETIRAILG